MLQRVQYSKRYSTLTVLFRRSSYAESRAGNLLDQGYRHGWEWYFVQQDMYKAMNGRVEQAA